MLSCTTQMLSRGARPVLLAVLLLALLLTGSTVGYAEETAVSDLSRAEMRRLTDGHLISRPVTRRRGDQRLMGGTCYQVIDAPMHVVWAALLDTPRYTRMMPEVIEARLIKRNGAKRTVFVRQGSLPVLRVEYYLNVKVNEARHDIEFRLDETRPHDLDSAYGFYNLRPYEGGRTLLTYGVMADIGGGLFAAVTRDSVHEWMLKTPWMVKRFIEGSGKHIYRW